MVLFYIWIFIIAIVPILNIGFKLLNEGDLLLRNRYRPGAVHVLAFLPKIALRYEDRIISPQIQFPCMTVSGAEIESAIRNRTALSVSCRAQTSAVRSCAQYSPSPKRIPLLHFISQSYMYNSFDTGIVGFHYIRTIFLSTSRGESRECVSACGSLEPRA